MDTCESCLYLKRGGDEDWDRCYRYPTGIVIEEDRWCGEYKERPYSSLPRIEETACIKSKGEGFIVNGDLSFRIGTHNEEELTSLSFKKEKEL